MESGRIQPGNEKVLDGSREHVGGGPFATSGRCSRRPISYGTGGGTPFISLRLPVYHHMLDHRRPSTAVGDPLHPEDVTDSPLSG